MNRTNRTLLVFLLSVLVAGVASFFVYSAVQSIPVREVEVRSYYVAVAAKALPVGTMLAASRRQAGGRGRPPARWPAATPRSKKSSTAG